MKVVIDRVEYVPVVEQPVAPKSMTLKAYLTKRRLQFGWSMEEAAEKIGCSKGYVWELENQIKNPSLKMALKICKAYGFSANIYELLEIG